MDMMCVECDGEMNELALAASFGVCVDCAEYSDPPGLSLDAKRDLIVELEESIRAAQKDVERLRGEVYKASGPLPAPGSKWKKHDSFAAAWEMDLVWTYVATAQDDRARQVAVIQRTVVESPPVYLSHRTYAYLKTVQMETFLVEYTNA